MKNLAVACLLAFVCQTTQAEMPALGWGLSAGAQFENVQEFDSTGKRLLTEQGFLSGGTLHANAHWSAASLMLTLGHHRGSLDYDGQTQSGSAFSTRTQYQNTKASLIADWTLASSWGLQTGLEREWRKRQIQGIGMVAGMKEHYRSDWAVAGLRWRHEDFDIALQGIWGVGGTQTVSSPNLIDPVNFKSGQLRGWRGEANIPLKKIVGTHVSLRPNFESLTIQRSKNAVWTLDGVPQGSLAQPKTRRWAAGINLVTTW